MHPLVARIHPSFRTAFFAWFIGRGLLWLVALAAGRPMPPLNLQSEGGGPLWRLMLSAYGAGIDLLGGQLAAWSFAGLGEALLLMSAVAVYRFTRKDDLPQTAERTTWLWMLCPAMIFAWPGSVWSFAIPLAALATSAAAAGRGGWSAVLISLTIALRPEAIVCWPGIAALSTRHGARGTVGPWLAWLLPVVAFSSVVLAATFFGAELGISLRSLAAGTAWRDFAWQGWQAHLSDLPLAAVLLVGLGLTLRSLRRDGWCWPLLSLPCLIWPLLQEPSTPAMAVLLFALPLFVQGARTTEDPGFERPVLVGCAIALAVLAMRVVIG